MLMRHNPIHCLTAVVTCALYVQHAEAVLIRVTPSGGGSATTVFYDDFENAPNGISTADYPDASGDYDPDNGSHPGFWAVDEPTGINEVQVTNFVDSRPLGPFLGNNYARFGRDSANFHPLAVMENAAVTGDQIVIETMFAGGPGYDTSSAGFSLVTDDDPSAPGDNVIAVSFTPGGTVRNRTPFLSGSERFEGIGGLTWSPNEWNYLKIEYTIGDPDYDLTINRDTVEGIVIAFPNGVNDAVPGVPTIASSLKIAGHSSPSGVGSRLLVDAVPEPSTVGLISVAAGAFACSLLRRR